MAEYSRLASGQVTSTGGNTVVVVPFVPNFIEIFNATRAAAASGVTRASWLTDMGQGAAFVVTTSAGPADGTSFITSATGTGFTTIQAGLSLQYGASQLVTSISKASPGVVTTTSPHGLVSGNVVVFQNIAQTSSTGMQQIAGIPFVVTVTGASTFTIPWNTGQSNYTAISGGGLNTLAAFKKVLYPALYAPGTAFISAITTGATTAITTTSPHNFQVGQEVAFRIPTAWGTSQLNSLPNVLIPGSPVYGFVTAVGSSTTLTVNINSSAYTAFNSNQPFASYPGEFFPQVLAVGDANTGFGANSNAPNSPSPTLFNGFSTSATSTINGPALLGAYFNATFQGFVIGSGVAGTAADTIFWLAYMHDLNT